MNTKKTRKPILQEDNIILQASYADRWSAIQACGEVLVKQGYVRAAYIEDMMERERLVSVYVGNHVAIPHGIVNSEQHILESGLSVLQIPEGVDFDGEKVYIMIGIPFFMFSNGMNSSVAFSDRARVYGTRAG